MLNSRNGEARQSLLFLWQHNDVSGSAIFSFHDFIDNWDSSSEV